MKDIQLALDKVIGVTFSQVTDTTINVQAESHDDLIRGLRALMVEVNEATNAVEHARLEAFVVERNSSDPPAPVQAAGYGEGHHVRKS